MPLVVRTSGKESFVSACGDTSCSGLGKCGKCWAYCTIPLLNLKAKDELNTPHLMAMALQADGWWLRQTIVWDKKNPMPESVNDRCTKAHEYIFLLSKSARYFYDAQAIAEDATTGFNGSSFTDGKTGDHQQGRAGQGDRDELSSRNKRSVWTVSTKPYKHAHFAVFPPDLIEPCILAGTSQEGCCDKCGAPFDRITDSERVATRPAKDTKTTGDSMVDGNRDPERHVTRKVTKGWQPTCKCANPVPTPCTVLDPFGGSGTTGEVAQQLGCHAILIELNPKYIDMQKKRVEQRSLLA